MYQSIRERHKRIFDTWSSCKSLRETARTFGLSEGRVYQIVKLYKQRLLDEQNMDSSNDPWVKALYDDKISSRLYNCLVRYGYGKTFGIEELRDKLKTNTLDIWEVRDLGKKGLAIIRNIFLTQEEIDVLNNKD